MALIVLSAEGEVLDVRHCACLGCTSDESVRIRAPACFCPCGCCAVSMQGDGAACKKSIDWLHSICTGGFAFGLLEVKAFCYIISLPFACKEPSHKEPT